MTELYKKHRPLSFKQMRGQASAVSQLLELVRQGRVPHALLFSGPSGTGKTTAARILANKLGCGPTDLEEINTADFRGIESVRSIRRNMHAAAMGGSSRVWIIDEAHMLSNEAQQAFLKYLEDTPSHVYFMLATTRPEKLDKAIHTRCTEVRMQSVEESEIVAILTGVCARESLVIDPAVLERIAEVSEGSPRKALVLLQQIQGLPEDQRLEAIQKADSKRDSREIVRLLLDRRTSWAIMAKALKGIGEDPESLRHMILAYCNAMLLNNARDASRVFLIIRAFQDPFYDWKEAALAASCYSVICAE